MYENVNRDNLGAAVTYHLVLDVLFFVVHARLAGP